MVTAGRAGDARLCSTLLGSPLHLGEVAGGGAAPPPAPGSREALPSAQLSQAWHAAWWSWEGQRQPTVVTRETQLSWASSGQPGLPAKAEQAWLPGGGKGKMS